MKKIRKELLVLLLAIVLSSLASAQQKVSLAIYQDARLAITGDGVSYPAGTVDILSKFKMQGHQKETGFLVVAPFFEYAEIEGIYKRYGFDVGFTYNESMINGLAFTPSINYSIQDRWSKNWLVFGVDFELSYELARNFKLCALAQFVERKDLKWAYNDYKIRFSGFVGVEINLN